MKGLHMFKRWWNTLRIRINEPLLVDRRLDICAAIHWLLLGIWGVFAAVSEATSVSAATGQDYSIPWGLSIGVLGLISAIAALSTLFQARPKLRIFKKTVELISVSLMTGLVSVFPLIRLITLFTHLGSDDITANISALAVSLFFVVFPTWRIFHLTGRIRGLRKIETE